MTGDFNALGRTLQEQILDGKRAENRFRGLLEAAPYAMVILNSENKIILTNAKAEQLLGYRRSEFINQSIEFLIPERYRTSYISNLGYPGMGTELELHIRLKEGRELPVEMNISAFKTDDEALIAIVIRDISKRVELTKVLAEERRLLHMLMDNMPDLIYFKDAASRFTRINQAHARMLGANEPGDAIGKTDVDFQDPELSKGFLEEEKKIVQTGEPVINREEFNPAPDGTPRWYSTTKVPMKDIYGHVTGIVGISHDITRRKQMEEALLNSEEQFHSTFTYAAIGMALVGLDGSWLQVNKAVCEIVGYSEEELLSKTFQDITHPDDLDTDLHYVQQLLAGEIQSYQMEKRYLHKQGYEVWVLLSVSLVRDTEGKPLYFVSQIQDITERKWTEAALRTRMQEDYEFQTSLKALHAITIELTNINDLDMFYKKAVEFGLQRLGFDRLGLLLYDPENGGAIGTYGTDAQGNLVAEHQLRLDPTNLTGILSRVLEKSERFVVDEDARLFSNFQAIGSGWNAAAVLWNGTETLGWLACDNGVRHQPISKSQLDILALYALTLGSLLAQKRTQTALADQRNLLRTLIDTLPDYIYVKDRQSRFVLANQATIKSLGASTSDEVIGKTDFDFHSRELAGEFFADEQALLESGKTLMNKEEIITGPDGTKVYLSSIKIPIRDTQGQITGLLGANRDMTERRQLQSVLMDKEKLQAALEKELELSQLKSRMMERISHEFRTPLTVIQLTTETLTTYFDRLAPEKRAEKTETIQRATQRLTDMLDGINSVVKEGFDAEALHLFRLNLRYIIDACTYELEQQLQLHEKYVLNLPDTIMVMADRDIIKVALFHVFQNAARYSASQSLVIVELFPVESGLELHVTDKGIGIPPNELPRIFDPFFRGSNINEVGGLGIGLTLGQRAIEAHKGTIQVESDLGAGTTVKIRLP